MKIVTLSTLGIGKATAYKTPSISLGGVYYYAIRHGQDGNGGWQVKIPLNTHEFPCFNNSPESILLDGNYELIDTKRKDILDNPQFTLERGVEDGVTIILWHLSPPYGGGANFRLWGSAWLLAKGYEAQGDDGRMGGAYCPIVYVNGPCILAWHWTDRLTDWTATYDGKQWIVGPAEKENMVW